MGHPGFQEGLRCARGFAADGRWGVTVEMCSESLESIRETSRNFPGVDVTSAEELSGSVRFVVATNDTSHKYVIPDWVHLVTPDEALLLGLSADVVLMF